MAFEILLHALLHKRTLVFCGSGGVGKTTLAAATALYGALLGRRVLVVTIDPARRLASSLGLSELGNKAVPIDLSSLPQPPAPGGSLHAMMLDTKTAADELVAKFARSPDGLQTVLNNPIYKGISESMSGSQEYVAMGKIYELIRRPEFDTIVVDTAPTKYALDFFEAPTRILDLLDAKIVRRLVQPIKKIRHFGWDMFRKGSTVILETIERLIGLSALSDISQFILDFEEMFIGLRDRSALMHQELQNAGATILGIVFSANAASVDEAIFFSRRLLELGMPLGFMIANRVHESPFSSGEEQQWAASLLDDASKLAQFAQELTPAAHAPSPDLVRSAVQGASTADRFAQIDQYHIERIRRELGSNIPLITIPFLEHDIYDLTRLYALGKYLFEEAAVM